MTRAAMAALRRATRLFTICCAATLLVPPAAHADNRRRNDSAVANVYTIQRQAGCTNNVPIDPQLRLAAQWHTHDVLTNRALEADIGPDLSTMQNRANAAGFHGVSSETVAMGPRHGRAPSRAVVTMR